MTKKIISAVTALMLALTLASCDKSSDTDKDESTEKTTTAVTKQENSAVDDKTESKADENSAQGLGVKSLNGYAKIVYNAAVTHLCDKEAEGKNIGDVFDGGDFSASNSSEGMTFSAGNTPDGAGDKMIYEALTDCAKGDITIYVSSAKDYDLSGFFVQVRDNVSGRIGQYPNPIGRGDKAEWTEFYGDMPVNGSATSDTEMTELDVMNDAAKYLHSKYTEYLLDCAIDGKDIDDVYKKGTFAISNSDTGLKTGDGSLKKGDGDILLEKSLAPFCGDGFWIYVSRAEDHNDMSDVYVHVMDKENGIIGQYPDPIAEGSNVIWTQKYDGENTRSYSQNDLQSCADMAFVQMSDYLINNFDDGVEISEALSSSFSPEGFVVSSKKAPEYPGDEYLQ